MTTTDTNAKAVTQYRASAEPMAFLCPASVNAPPGEIAIDAWNAAGEIGQAAHSVAPDVVIADGSMPDLELAARKHGLTGDDEKDFRFLCYAVSRFWREYRGFFPEPQTEVALSHTYKADQWGTDRDFTVSGHMDLRSVLCSTGEDGQAIPRIIRVADYKSTRLEHVNYHEQLMRYLVLSATEFPTAEEFQYMLVFLRDRTVEISPVLSMSDLADHHQAFVDQVVNWDGRTYSTGAHCRYCRRLDNCPAHAALVKTTISELRLQDDEEVALPAKADQVLDLYERASVVAGLCERFRGHVRALVAQQPEQRLVTGGAKDLAIVTQDRQQIRPAAGWPILTKHLTLDELEPCITIGKTALMDAIGAKTPRGRKGKARAEVLAELVEAEAITIKPVAQLRTVRAAATGTETTEKQLETDHVEETAQQAAP